MCVWIEFLLINCLNFLPLVDLKITERVACFLVDPIPFSKLCGTENLTGAKIVGGDNEHLGYLTYDKDNLLGKGTFKTVHLSSLKQVSDPPSFGLGAQTSKAIHVALKRPYNDSCSGINLKHFNYADKSWKVLTEGTLLGWADFLLQSAYEFINDFIANQALVEVPFEIPQLRFVKAAIAYLEKLLNNALGASSSTSHHVAYLLEELFPTGNLFIKYIHNADAIPLQDHDEPGYNTAIFLCFIQHVQFILTHGQAYISDF